MSEVIIDQYPLNRNGGQVWITMPADIPPVGPFSSDDLARRWLEDNKVAVDTAVAAANAQHEQQQPEVTE
jgi:hypothetical protein